MYLDGGLGHVVRIAVLGGDVEAEVGSVLDHVVAELNAHRAALLERLLQQQRLLHDTTSRGRQTSPPLCAAPCESVWVYSYTKWVAR